tara:strand:+ start:6192 stop:6635 length:444 start_codon:yes stop_codon:yes gene_type:complete
MSLELVPITLRAASLYVSRHHRHHKPPQGGLFAVAVASAGEIVGVAIVAKPVARMLDDGWTCEVRRVATDGTKNACSKLYGAAWRAARALGYRRCVTYTLQEEGGASLRGAGWRCLGEAGGGSWTRRARPRVDEHPLQIKIRWQRST